MINTYVAYTPVLFLYVPDHRCKGYEGASTAPPSAVNATALLGNEAFMREVGGTEEVGTECKLYQFKQSAERANNTCGMENFGLMVQDNANL